MVLVYMKIATLKNSLVTYFFVTEDVTASSNADVLLMMLLYISTSNSSADNTYKVLPIVLLIILWLS